MLFIDANIYLNFYSADLPTYRTLLGTLEAIKKHLFVPEQIVLEVERNRLGVYNDTAKDDLKQVSTKFRTVKAHFSPNDENSVKTFNDNCKHIDQSIQAQAAKLREIQNKNRDAILKGEDDVSTALNSIFGAPAIATPQELDRARIRRERGQPPGKREDPLGDQLSWEQFLSRAKGQRKVWFVSQDNDYYESIGDKLYLKTTLRRELGAGVDVECHKKLVHALTAFQNALPELETLLPDAQILENINSEIEAASTHQHTKEQCPRCGSSKINWRQMDCPWDSSSVLREVFCEECKHVIQTSKHYWDD